VTTPDSNLPLAALIDNNLTLSPVPLDAADSVPVLKSYGTGSVHLRFKRPVVSAAASPGRASGGERATVSFALKSL